MRKSEAPRAAPGAISHLFVVVVGDLHFYILGLRDQVSKGHVADAVR
jgi:hypothetical protein